MNQHRQLTRTVTVKTLNLWFVSLAMVVTLVVGVNGVPAGAASLVVNGDFEAGNTGFSSDFVFEDPTNTTAPAYGIVSDPNAWHPAASTYGDHTTGSGLMLVANGVLPSGGDTTVWEQTVSVSPGNDFELSFYISSWYFAPFADLEALINGVSIGSVTAPSTLGTWEQAVLNWSSGAATMATLRLVNTSEAVGGNDFAIDDISFVQTSDVSPVPLPAAFPLFAGGLGVLGLLGWRRKRKTEA